MKTNQEHDRLTQEVLREHKRLIDQISETGSGLSFDLMTQSEVCQHIEQLMNLVESHFEHEENCGYLYSNVDDNEPASNPIRAAADDLVAEHEELMELGQKLSMLSRSGVDSPEWRNQVDKELQQFTKRLLAHEAAENKLLSDSRADV